jgi:hypothetical protein
LRGSQLPDSLRLDPDRYHYCDRRVVRVTEVGVLADSGPKLMSPTPSPCLSANEETVEKYFFPGFHIYIIYDRSGGTPEITTAIMSVPPP